MDKETPEYQKLQKLEIPKHVSCTLYKDMKESWNYVARQLLNDFKVGARCDVGSVHTIVFKKTIPENDRTFGNDWWSTSPVQTIDDKKYNKDQDATFIYFTTVNNRYLLQFNGDIDKIIASTEKTKAETEG